MESLLVKLGAIPARSRVIEEKIMETQKKIINLEDEVDQITYKNYSKKKIEMVGEYFYWKYNLTFHIIRVIIFFTVILKLMQVSAYLLHVILSLNNNTILFLQIHETLSKTKNKLKAFSHTGKPIPHKDMDIQSKKFADLQQQLSVIEES